MIPKPGLSASEVKKIETIVRAATALAQRAALSTFSERMP